MAKNPQDNIKPLPRGTQGAWQHSLDQRSFMEYPGGENWKERTAHTMLLWVEEEDAETIMGFCRKYHVPRDTLRNWVKSDETFKKTYDLVKLILADKDIQGAKHKRYDKDVVFKYLHKLDPDYEEINKYHADLKKPEETNNGNRTIIVEMQMPKGPTENTPKAE